MRALILGGAADVWGDETAARDLAIMARAPFDAVICCNDAGAVYQGGGFLAWVSLHPDKFAPQWLPARRAKGLRDPEIIAGHKQAAGVNYVESYAWTEMENTGSGSSGLFAVKIALGLGFDRIVLAGVPMGEKQGRFFDPAPWRGEHFKAAWHRVRERIAPNVRSVSGWTRELLGAPDAEWLRG